MVGNNENSTSSSKFSSSGGSNSIGTPRFTADEKELLFKLFHEYEKLIDIKYRKTLKGKISVSGTWDTIMEKFNSNPKTTTHRNVKQIQKFWLNSRLRKQYPNKLNGGNERSSEGRKAKVKVEPEIQVIKQPQEDQNEQETEYEQLEMATNEDNNMIETVQSPTPTQPSTLPSIHTAQHINVDQISAEKLTLTDLLKFKSTRPREDLIVQINTDQAAMMQPPQKIHLSHPTTTFKQIIAELPQQTQIATSQQQQPTSSYCTYTTTTNLNAYNAHTVNPTVSNASTSMPPTESFEEKINFYKVKEAELKYKEEQLQLERQRIDLTRAQEELKQSREYNRLRLEEIKIKIRILSEQEKQLNKK